LDFSKDFDNCLSQHPSGQSVQHTARQVYNMLGGQQADGLVEFTFLRDMGKARSIVRTLNFRKANFQLSRS